MLSSSKNFTKNRKHKRNYSKNYKGVDRSSNILNGIKKSEEVPIRYQPVNQPQLNK